MLSSIDCLSLPQRWLCSLDWLLLHVSVEHKHETTLSSMDGKQSCLDVEHGQLPGTVLRPFFCVLGPLYIWRCRTGRLSTRTSNGGHV